MIRMLFLSLVLMSPLAAEASVAPAVECGEDEGCFFRAVQHCQPAGLSSVEHRAAGTLSRQTYRFRHQILGRTEEHCLISVKFSGMEIRFTDAFLSDMSGRGLSSDQLADMQGRFRRAQGLVTQVLHLNEPRRYRIQPRRYDPGVLRRMNSSFLPGAQ